MKMQNPEVKDKLGLHLRRVEGQVRGVQRMLEEERDCRAIMQQLAAIHASVQSASRIFLGEYAAACLREAGSEGAGPARTQAQLIQDMLALMDKTP